MFSFLRCLIFFTFRVFFFIVFRILLRRSTTISAAITAFFAIVGFRRRHTFLDAVAVTPLSRRRHFLRHVLRLAVFLRRRFQAFRFFIFHCHFAAALCRQVFFIFAIFDGWLIFRRSSVSPLRHAAAAAVFAGYCRLAFRADTISARRFLSPVFAEAPFFTIFSDFHMFRLLQGSFLPFFSRYHGLLIAEACSFSQLPPLSGAAGAIDAELPLLCCLMHTLQAADTPRFSSPASRSCRYGFSPDVSYFASPDAARCRHCSLAAVSSPDAISYADIDRLRFERYMRQAGFHADIPFIAVIELRHCRQYFRDIATASPPPPVFALYVITPSVSAAPPPPPPTPPLASLRHVFFHS